MLPSSRHAVPLFIELDRTVFDLVHGPKAKLVSTTSYQKVTAMERHQTEGREVIGREVQLWGI